MRTAMLLASIATALLPALARAQTPGDVIATTQAVGGSYADCLLAIESVETGGTYDPFALNPSSGAYGPLQYMQSGGVWGASPLGENGLAVTAASLVQQISMAVWAWTHGLGSAWSGSAPASCYGGG